MLFFLILTNALMIAIFIITYRALPPEIPLFYNFSWGESRLGHPLNLSIIIILMDIFFVLTSTILKRYYLNDEFIKKIIQIIQLIYITISFVAFIRIIWFSI